MRTLADGGHGQRYQKTPDNPPTPPLWRYALVAGLITVVTESRSTTHSVRKVDCRGIIKTSTWTALRLPVMLGIIRLNLQACSDGTDAALDRLPSCPQPLLSYLLFWHRIKIKHADNVYEPHYPDIISPL